MTQMILSMKQKQTYGQREETCGCQGEEGELKTASLRIANAKYSMWGG